MLLLHGYVFLSAWLLFMVELAAAKAMLPGFGGSSLVWATSVLVFQVLLLGGYAWAAWLSPRIRRPRWRLAHGLLLLAPAALFPVALERFTPSYQLASWAEIAFMLAATIGPGLMLLATASVTTQTLLAASVLPWRTRPQVLYATSNLGSFAGLLAYPLLVEPRLDLADQFRLWQGGYLLAALLGWLLLWRLLPGPSPDASGNVSGNAAAMTPHAGARERLPSPASRQRLAWLGLAAAGSGLFLAVTTMITMDLAAIPLLWIVPLAIYLLTFALAFKPRPWLPRLVQSRLPVALAVGGFLFVLASFSYQLPVVIGLPMHWLVLAVVCLVVHGRLARLMPADPRHLGGYYLTISLGGAVGSLLASFLAPMLGAGMVEYPLTLALAAGSLALADRLEKPRTDPAAPRTLPWRDAAPALGCLGVAALWPVCLSLWPDLPTNLLAAAAGLGLALLFASCLHRPGRAALCLLALLAGCLLAPFLQATKHVLHTHRNFYGVTTVHQDATRRHLKHGTTLHGSQLLDPARSGTAMTYYHRTTPSGQLLARQDEVLPRRLPMALVGLGAGSLAVYAWEGQPVDIYELDPHNGHVARTWFSFLAQSNGTVALTFGDARLTLRQAADERYGILVVDAFNSDAIPMHLLTVEAFREYGRKLAPGGLALLHISNKYLDLEPAVLATGREAGFLVLQKSLLFDIHPEAEACLWMVLTRDEATAARLRRLDWKDLRQMPAPPLRPWTDRFSNMMDVLR